MYYVNGGIEIGAGLTVLLKPSLMFAPVPVPVSIGSSPPPSTQSGNASAPPAAPPPASAAGPFHTITPSTDRRFDAWGFAVIALGIASAVAGSDNRHTSNSRSAIGYGMLFYHSALTVSLVCRALLSMPVMGPLLPPTIISYAVANKLNGAAAGLMHGALALLFGLELGGVGAGSDDSGGASTVSSLGIIAIAAAGALCSLGSTFVAYLTEGALAVDPMSYNALNQMPATSAVSKSSAMADPALFDQKL